MAPCTDWFHHPGALDWTTEPLHGISGFHASLPGYAPTPLRDVPTLAAELGVGRVFVKEESARLGLPAFKILGASYAVCRALSGSYGAPDRALGLDELRAQIAEHGGPTLFAATDGNHGRAVAHMARLLGLSSQIFFPAGLTDAAKAAIAGEGAQTTELDGSYDEVVQHAAAKAQEVDGLLVQDTSWPGYEQIPQWVVDGYSTLFREIDGQLADAGEVRLDLAVVPVGVGSFAQAAVQHYRGSDRPVRTRLLSVEPQTAPGVIASLHAGRRLASPTSSTIMSGLNCGTPAAGAWPYLAAGLDAATTVSDTAAGAAVHDLEAFGVDSGPCGAATLAGVRGALAHRESLHLVADSVVVLVSTEGRAANPLPEGDRR